MNRTIFELHAQSANGFISLPERISFWRNFCFSAFFLWPVFFFGILLKNYETDTIHTQKWDFLKMSNGRDLAKSTPLPSFVDTEAEFLCTADEKW